MEYSRTAAEFNRQVLHGGGLLGLPGEAAVARGLSMLGLREPQGMAHVEQALSVWRMRICGVRHRRHHLSGHAETAQTLFPSDVVGRRAKERGECR